MSNQSGAERPRPHVGEPVRVFDVNGRRVGQPEGGWHGTVTKVGPKLVTIEYHGHRPTVFRVDTRRCNGGGYGYQRWYETAAGAANMARETAALAVLKENCVQLLAGHELTLEQIEDIAALLAGSATGQARALPN